MALLWDLDNIMCRRRDLLHLARTLAGLAGPEALLVAAGRRPAYRATREPLTSLGFTVLSGGKRANGVDQALLNHAALVHRRDGVRRFVVVSHDHAFTRLPIGTHLTVAAPAPEHVSHRLLAAADEVVLVTLRNEARRAGAEAQEDAAAGVHQPLGVATSRFSA